MNAPTPPPPGPSPWRFIAAARCPRCGAEDKVRLRVGAAGQRRNCVSCGHDEMLLAQTPVADVPGGRLDPDGPAAADDPNAPHPVRLMDPDGP